MPRFFAAALAFVLLICAGVANAQSKLHCDHDGRCVQAAAKRRKNITRIITGDPRPRAWCAWWLRRELRIARNAFRPYDYNLARAFRYIGSAATEPAEGVIVVWRHHVGIITGRSAEGWRVKSGNDGGRGRERVRSVKGAIAFRWPEQMWASR